MMQRTTPVVLNLIIINVLVFIAQSMFPAPTPETTSQITDVFALHHYKSPNFKPHQLITYMFMHGGIFHLFFNMFSLWMFGTMLENYLGAKRFILLYLICGIGAGLTQLGSYTYDFWQYDNGALSPELYGDYKELLKIVNTVGASGAIMGVLAAFGYLFPNTEMMIIPIPFPIKAKWAISGMIALDVFGGVVKVQGDHIAHFAHIGGAAIGFLIVLIWNKTNRKTFY